MISICLEKMTPGKKAAIATAGLTGTAFAAPELGAAVSQKLGEKNLEKAAQGKSGVSSNKLNSWKEKAKTVKGREEIKADVTSGSKQSAEAGNKALRQYDVADTFKSVSPGRILKRQVKNIMKKAREAHDSAQG